MSRNRVNILLYRIFTIAIKNIVLIYNEITKDIWIDGNICFVLIQKAYSFAPML